MIDLSPEGWAQVWAVCRWANQYAPVLAVIVVAYRLTLMGLDRGRWADARATHLLLWFIWIACSLLVSSLAAAYYERGTTPASALSGIRLALNLAAGALALWWPHPSRYVPLEGAR